MSMLTVIAAVIVMILFAYFLIGVLFSFLYIDTLTEREQDALTYRKWLWLILAYPSIIINGDK